MAKLSLSLCLVGIIIGICYAAPAEDQHINDVMQSFVDQMRTIVKTSAKEDKFGKQSKFSKFANAVSVKSHGHSKYSKKDEGANYCEKAGEGEECSEEGHKCYHRSNPYVYLVCSNLGWVAMDCPLGTIYNRENKECSFGPAHAVELFKPHRQRVEHDDDDEDEHEEVVSAAHGMCGSAHTGNACYQTGQRCPSGGNRYAFLVCSISGWVQMDCPPGTRYNVRGGDCSTDEPRYASRPTHRAAYTPPRHSRVFVNNYVDPVEEDDYEDSYRNVHHDDLLHLFRGGFPRHLVDHRFLSRDVYHPDVGHFPRVPYFQRGQGYSPRGYVVPRYARDESGSRRDYNRRVNQLRAFY